MASRPLLTIVIPVYNEGANFKPLWSVIAASIRTPFDAIVVYDFDQDNTLPVIADVIAAGESRIQLPRTVMAKASPEPLRLVWRRWNPGRCW